MSGTLDTGSPKRRCSTCKELKPLSDFNRHSARKDGLDSKCRECNGRRGREWYRRKQAATHRLYSVYVAMKQRCYNKKHDHFATYGGRGIRVCDE